MFDKLFRYGYGFITLGFIEFGKFIETGTNLMNFSIFFLQFVIGFLTIAKLIKDVRGNKFVSTEKTQKAVEKKYPILTALLKIFKNNRNENI
jgi:Na+/H+ antiporter NhaC